MYFTFVPKIQNPAFTSISLESSLNISELESTFKNIKSVHVTPLIKTLQEFPSRFK